MSSFSIVHNVHSTAVPVEVLVGKTLQIKVASFLTTQLPPIAPPETFKQYMTTIPHWEKNILQNLEFLSPPQEVYAKLINIDVYSMGDGGTANNVGSYGLILSTKTGLYLVKCNGSTFGYSRTSFWCEAIGILSIAKLIHHLYQYYGRLI